MNSRHLRNLNGWAVKISLVIVVAVAIGLVAHPHKVAADSFCTNMNGQSYDCHYGYFYAQRETTGGNVISEGIRANDAGSFIGQLYNAINGCPDGGKYPTKDQNATGASFIILTMLGYPYQTDKQVSCSEFHRWEALIYAYDSQGLINWNAWQGYSVNTFYQPTQNDDAFFQDNASDWTIAFLSPVDGHVLYSIRKACGNPVGNLEKLQNPDQPPVGAIDSLSCTGASGWAYDPDSPGSSIIFRVYVNGYLDGQAYAAGPRPDINSRFGIPGNHGWATGITDKAHFNPRSGNTIEIKIIDAQTGGETSLGARNVGPCVSGSCTTSTFPESMPVGQQQSFVARVDLSTDWGPPYSVSPNPALNSPAFYVQVFGPDPANKSIFNSAVGYNAGNPAGKHITSDPVNFTPTTPGTYKVQWTFAGQGLNIECGWNKAGGGTPNTGTAAYEPYFSVLGGDVAAGPGFGASCSPNATAGITGRNLGSGANYYGAGSQFGALALGAVNNFASALGGIAGASGPPASLTFANTSSMIAGDGTGTYGGSFSKPTWCVPDYVRKAQDNPPAPKSFGPTLDQATLTTLANGKYTVTGDHLTIGGNLQLAQGQKITIVVTGDVYIDGNVTYAAYTQTNEIPQFQLLVKGNIYINNLVSTLHGFYTAQSTGATGATGATGGTIHTCSTAMGIPVVGNDPATDYDTCNHALAFYGGVAAKTIKLERTFGNLVSPQLPAEQFIYTPELWLGDLGAPASGTQPYQSVTSLPPIL